MRFCGLPRPENLNGVSRLAFNNMKRLVYLGVSLAACALCFVMVRTPPVKKSGTAVEEAQRRLRAFESGSMTMEDITDNEQISSPVAGVLRVRNERDHRKKRSCRLAEF